MHELRTPSPTPPRRPPVRPVRCLCALSRPPPCKQVRLQRLLALVVAACSLTWGPGGLPPAGAAASPPPCDLSPLGNCDSGVGRWGISANGSCVVLGYPATLCPILELQGDPSITTSVDLSQLPAPLTVPPGKDVEGGGVVLCVGGRGSLGAAWGMGTWRGWEQERAGACTGGAP